MVKRIAIWSGILLLALFITQRIFFFSPGFLENAASFITYPVLYISSSLTSPIKKFFKEKQESKKLYARAETVLKKYRELVDENIKLKATLEFHNKIKDLIDFQERYKLDNGIRSKVLIKNFTDTSHSIILNKGRRDGIRKDMVAIHNTQLVGRVSEVFPSYCQITLITDSDCKVAAHTSKSKTHGIVVGANVTNSCSLSYVSHLENVSDDDLVISSGQGLVFPEGFCLGRIAQHTKNGLYHSIEITPLIDFTNLEFCVLLDRDSTLNF